MWLLLYILSKKRRNKYENIINFLNERINFVVLNILKGFIFAAAAAAAAAAGC